VNEREVATVLRRLADALEKGEARGEIAVEVRGREYVVEQMRDPRDGFNVRRELRSTGEHFKIEIESLRQVSIVDCLICGREHQIGRCPVDKAFAVFGKKEPL
jgi:hypothetical protein